MLGAIIGDTIGSVYEFENIKTITFESFFHPESEFTDDSILFERIVASIDCWYRWCNRIYCGGVRCTNCSS